MMRSWIRSNLGAHWPLFASLALLYAIVGVMVFVALQGSQGHFVYALDDSYISMAIGKNLALHGTWGITRHEFSSASSSIAWPLLLAATNCVLGTVDLAPLFWNIAWATLLLYLCYRFLQIQGARPSFTFASLAAVILLTPLPTLIMIGLEHTLHVLLTIAVVSRAALELAQNGDRRTRLPSPLLMLLVALLVAVRYEGLFVVGALSIMFATRKRWISSVLVTAGGCLPALAYGVISISKGGYFLPNSVLSKGSLTPRLISIRQSGFLSETGLRQSIGLLGYRAYEHLLLVPHVLFLLAVALLLVIVRYRRARSFWEPGSIMTWLFVGATLLHMQFARSGWLYRYEAYLVALGVLVVARMVLDHLSDAPGFATIRDALPRYAAMALLACFPITALAFRSVAAAVRTPQAMRNIYEQQYQMALFLREYYEGASVVAHDVGAINYLADLHCVDVVGLANRESLTRNLEGTLDREAISTIAHDSSIAVIYDAYLGEHGGAPTAWIRIGTWTIPGNVVCRDDTVTFYAIDPAQVDRLASNLRRFSPRLPPDVRQGGEYVEGGDRRAVAPAPVHIGPMKMASSAS